MRCTRTWRRRSRAGGAHVDGWYYCPHHPRAESTGAARRLRLPQAAGRAWCARRRQRSTIDLARSFVVGDKMADVGSARAVGARGVLVRTGYGEAIVRARGGTVPGAAFVAADLMEATVVASRREPSSGRTVMTATRDARAGAARTLRPACAPSWPAIWSPTSSSTARRRARVARGAGADPRLRLDRSRARRRRQRGEQRRGARRARRRRLASSGATTAGRAARRRAEAARAVGRA